MGLVDVNETEEKQSGILVGLYFRCNILVEAEGIGRIWKINSYCRYLLNQEILFLPIN